MRNIVSPLDGIRSPFGRAVTGGTPPAPALALAQRDNDYILDRAGDYIETRV